MRVPSPLIRTLAGLFLCAPWMAGCGSPGDSPSVLLIVIDTLRADRVGALGDPTAVTPTLDALAASGLVFADASTPVPVTLPAVTSLMTGLEPPAHGVRDNGVFALGESHETLAERFAAAGYRTGAVVASAVLAADRGLDRGFDHYEASFDGDYPVYDPTLQPYAREFAGNRRRADRVTDLALERLRGWKDHPFFLTVHFFDAHMQYDPPPPFAGRHPGRPYDGEVTFLDRQIGRLLSALPDRKNTIVVVVADHGESQGEHGEPQHGFLLYEATLSVPFLVSGPGIPIGVRRDPVSLIDVEPTLSAQLGLPGGAGPRDGQPLAWTRTTSAPGTETRTLYAETMHTLVSYGWRELRSLRRAGSKIIVSPEERYDLRADPRELAMADPTPEFSALADALADRIDADASPAEILARAQNPEDAQSRELLASLGYLSEAADAGPTERAHPRAELPRWIARQQAKTSLRRAAHWLSQGHSAAADSLAAQVLREVPTLVDAIAFRGYVAEQRGDLPGAAGWYEQVIAREPGHLQSRRGLGRIAQARGQEGLALEHWRVVAERDSTDADALRFVSLRLLGADRPADARRPLELLLSLDPEDPTTLYNLALACDADGDSAAAEDHLREFLKRAPHDPDAADIRRRLESRSGR